ncbi:MAG: hypothetical protein MUD01_04115, partial [Chloroflexaceae bacterium]|nr:hypothetical protein [Chloroflexaceae bacterium]
MHLFGSRIINKTRPALLFLILASLLAACGGPQQSPQVAQNPTTAAPPPTAVPPRPTPILPTPEPTPVPSPCTVATGGKHLVPFADGRWFLSGANVPWLNGGFGADFGTVEAWGQHTYDPAKAGAMFARLKESGANSVRWWVFADGRGAPEFDAPSGGKVTGLDERFLSTMADAIKQAAQNGIYIQFTMWSFDMLYADSTAQERG